MTELIAYEICRTESLSINGTQYTVRFTKRKDSDQHEIFAIDSMKKKSWRCLYSAEIAEEFEARQGQALEQHLEEILKSDIERGVI